MISRFGLGQRALFLIVALSAAFALYVFPSFADESTSAADSPVSSANRTVSVAVLGYPNYISYDASGEPHGYAVAYLQAIADYTGRTYDYQPMTLAEADEKVAKGELDIVVGNSGNPEADGVAYSAEPMGRGGMMLVSRLDDERYNYNDFNSYQGMKVGVLAGSSYRQPLIDILDAQGVDCTLIDYPSDEACKQALASGEVDVLEMNRTRCDTHSKIVGQLTSTDIYFLLSAADPSLKQGIDSAMTSILQRDPYFSEKLDEIYYGSAITTALTFDERSYLVKHPILRVAVLDDWYPFSYYDEASGTHKGMLIEYLDLLQSESGVRFEYVGEQESADVDSAVAQGRADIIGGFSADSSWASKHGYRLTDAPFTTPIARVSAQSELSTGRVALLEGGYIASALIARSSDAITPVYYSSVAAALDAVREGQVDYAELNGYEANYYLSQAKYSTLHTRIEANWNQSLTLAVPDTADPTLASLLNKEMGNISSDQIDAIVAHNTQVSYDFHVTDLVYTDPQAFYLIVVLMLVVTVFAIIMLWLFVYTRRQKAALARANEAKDAFLFDMSHEMRTPLSAIIGMNDIVKENADSDTLRQCSDNIGIASHHMLELVNDVLDMTKINEGKYEITDRLFDVNRMMEAIEVVYAPLAEQSGLHWDIDTDGGGDADLVGDELRLKQVLVNLISNAIKYNKPGGSVSVSMESLARDEMGQTLRFAVVDTGIGISDDDLSSVFEPFERVGTSTLREVAGTGLGLPIAKAICDAMGSRLQVESSLGRGSRFWFDVRLRHASAIERRNRELDSEAVVPVDLTGRHVLVAEDNAINALVLQHLLEERGAQVDVGSNGKQAVERYYASSEGYYSLILMDVRMPLMDGYEAARRIRASKRADASTIPIAAVSANAFAEDERRSLDAGMNAHVAKPIDAKAFDRTIERLLKLNGSR